MIWQLVDCRTGASLTIQMLDCSNHLELVQKTLFCRKLAGSRGGETRSTCFFASWCINIMENASFPGVDVGRGPISMFRPGD